MFSEKYAIPESEWTAKNILDALFRAKIDKKSDKKNAKELW